MFVFALNFPFIGSSFKTEWVNLNGDKVFLGGEKSKFLIGDKLIGASLLGGEIYTLLGG